ncbi:hypothetical protein J7E79_07425 [Bacillus sp. ISL-40]|uniref:hypothetical protein n=1 Tax=unclassified Bacillus (in: firmicutes) TaxID=185979 RepID=UPI001BE4EE5C|nr:MULTISPECIES: hypothetical protein [unclassified Bacillus (in: firmicutes)]MBT2697240.1 hypothetical protein [Bacillus sp. ISL-40]MBT2741193.1 hypothetical protein [Bacillus sp. ISL-77]
MSENALGIRKRYSHEIQEIGNKLSDLENGRIYELTDAKMDGYLATNIIQLRKMISDLLSKIDNQKESVNDEFSIFFRDK